MLSVRGIFFGAICALLLAYLCTFLIGYTAAIVMPLGYLEWAKELSSLWIFMYMWEAAVVQFLGATLPSFLLCYFMLRFLTTSKVAFFAAFLSGYIFFTYVFNLYVMEFQNYNFELTAWFLMHPVAIILGLGAALFFTKQRYY